MPSDRTRTSDDARQQYRACVAQQGRVILDRDLNALQGIVADEIRAQAADVVGLVGTPDDGFRIDFVPVGSPPPSPPSSPPPAAEATDFSISPGTMYLNGVRAVLPKPAAGPS